MANDIMKEIDRISEMELNDILEIYRRLLVSLRNKRYKPNELDNNWFHEIKRLKFDIVLYKEELQDIITNLEIEAEFPYFFLTLQLLILKVLNDKLENLNI
jgi:hypothetical protein